MKVIKLSNYTVEIAESLTWGEHEQLRSEIMGGLNVSANENKETKVDFQPSTMISAKYKALELVIKKIIDSNGKEVKYSKEWMNNLSVEDGDNLYNEIDKVTNPKKK